jgi:hypothetical protein
MTSDDSYRGPGDEAFASGSARRGEPSPTSGTFGGVEWRAILDPQRPRIVIDGREVDVKADGFGGFVTHQMFGRWYDLGELAQAIVRFHPDYSPLARRRDEPVA